MSQNPSGAIVAQWLIGKTPPDAQRLIDRMIRGDDIVRVAIMPDVHAASEVCVGSVIATRRLIYPAAVGGDIGCGMAAVAFDAGADVLAAEAGAARLMAGLRERVPVNRHRKPHSLPEKLCAIQLSAPPLDSIKRRDAMIQWGTLGRGNHFLEFQADEEDRLWLMVHSGSRAVGQAVRDFHVRAAPRSSNGFRALDADTPAGQAYLADAAWAATYAAGNRRAMVDAAANLLRELFSISMIDETFFDCDHNHIRREIHFDEPLWVHRKGALPAADGQPGIIPGSMGTRSHHVLGRGNPESLRSSSHGAGRMLSRGEAARKITPRDLERQMRDVWFNIHQAPALREEAPAAYKEIGRVMRAQRDLTRIAKTLRPVLSYKGGS